MKKLHILALAAVAAAAFATFNTGTVFAQSHSMSDCQGHMGHNAAQINQLHNALKLNAGQESAWQTMVTAMKTAHAEHAGMPSSSQTTAPAHVDAMLTMMHEHEVQVTSLGNAVKSFYATLTPTQRKTFDRAFQSHGMMH
ncbi:MAG: hypothetical protein DLM50_09875 [Candidatus Meridianibacter frigidus]|nr:MAG: hypothetical protein DLM50_09875 [Candidatus Eremiobacteraeota bacterium]